MVLFNNIISNDVALINNPDVEEVLAILQCKNILFQVKVLYFSKSQKHQNILEVRKVKVLITNNFN